MKKRIDLFWNKIFKKKISLIIILVLVLFGLLLSSKSVSLYKKLSTINQTHATDLETLPLSFIPNVGQADPAITFQVFIK